MKRAIILSYLFSIAFLAPSQEQGNAKYKITGDYLEGCACNLVCPCDLGQDATGKMGCQATMAWHIEKGHYGDTPLDGLTVVSVMVKPEKNISEAIGKLEGILYIDANANPTQRSALETIFRDQLEKMFGKLEGPQFETIRFSKSPEDPKGLSDTYTVEIPDILMLKNAAFKNKEGKRTVRLNSALPMIPKEYYAKSLLHTFHDKGKGIQWDYSGKNSFYGPFKYAT